MEISTTTVQVTLDIGQVFSNGILIFLVTFFGLIFYFKKQTILK